MKEEQASVALCNLLSRGATMSEARSKLGLEQPVKAKVKELVKTPNKEPVATVVTSDKEDTKDDTDLL